MAHLVGTHFNSKILKTLIFTDTMKLYISFSLSAPTVPIETTTDLKFPQHDDPTEICIMFSTGGPQGADSRSIFVTVQAENEGSEDLFVGKINNFAIPSILVMTS